MCLSKYARKDWFLPSFDIYCTTNIEPSRFLRIRQSLDNHVNLLFLDFVSSKAFPYFQILTKIFSKKKSRNSVKCILHKFLKCLVDWLKCLKNWFCWQLIISESIPMLRMLSFDKFRGKLQIDLYKFFITWYYIIMTPFEMNVSNVFNPNLQVIKVFFFSHPAYFLPFNQTDVVRKPTPFFFCISSVYGSRFFIFWRSGTQWKLMISWARGCCWSEWLWFVFRFLCLSLLFLCRDLHYCCCCFQRGLLSWFET